MGAQRGLRVCRSLKYRDAISILPVVPGNLAPAQPGVAPGIVGVKTPCRKRMDSDWHPRDDRLRGKAGTMRVGALSG